MRHKFTDHSDNPIIYHNTFEHGTTTGPVRLNIAPRENQIDLICQLLALMPGPFGFLYILVVTRSKLQEARYELDDELTLQGVTSLLKEHEDLFEQDARHILYIVSHEDNALIVYDRHNLVYLYGDLPRYTSLLVQLGFKEEKVEVPTLHAHHYHAEFDSCVEKLLSSHKWLVKPLRDIDRA